ncbi:MAG TPA: hypothetical protein VIY28_06645 [Pseudonocardiaceae bacterium]
MTSPRDVEGFRSPQVEPSPGVVLVCEDCDHIWEPSPAELGSGPLPCPQCVDWTVLGELATPEQREPAGRPTGDGPRAHTSDPHDRDW